MPGPGSRIKVKYCKSITFRRHYETERSREETNDGNCDHHIVTFPVGTDDEVAAFADRFLNFDAANNPLHPFFYEHAVRKIFVMDHGVAPSGALYNPENGVHSIQFYIRDRDPALIRNKKLCLDRNEDGMPDGKCSLSLSFPLATIEDKRKFVVALYKIKHLIADFLHPNARIIYSTVARIRRYPRPDDEQEEEEEDDEEEDLSDDGGAPPARGRLSAPATGPGSRSGSGSGGDRGGAGPNSASGGRDPSVSGRAYQIGLPSSSAAPRPRPPTSSDDAPSSPVYAATSPSYVPERPAGSGLPPNYTPTSPEYRPVSSGSEEENSDDNNEGTEENRRKRLRRFADDLFKLGPSMPDEAYRLLNKRLKSMHEVM